MDPGLDGSQENDGDHITEKPYQVRFLPTYMSYLLMLSLEQTAIAGVVKHEVNCNPVENAEYAQLVAERARQASKPKRGTVMLKGDVSMMSSNLLQPGTLGKGGDFRSFTVSQL
jgi:hypothetical protein